MSYKTKGAIPSRLVRNGIPDGYMVRLASMELKHFPTATRVEKTDDGGIDVYNERICFDHLRKDQFREYWPVQKEARRLR